MQNELKELPKDRLGSMDDKGHKIALHPADVKGRFMRWRSAFQSVLLVLFLVLPWVQINGHPVVLLNIAERRFSIFGLQFWAHDAPMLIFVAGTVLFGISLVTAVWGRIWCGWACPETVFVERVYRGLERWIEGNAIQRRRLDQSPWTLRKIWLRSLKWGAFTAVTLVITHSFLAYFVGIDALAVMVRHNPLEHPTSFGVMAFLSVVLLFFFGWFREQFCVIMCPYGRFQSVLLDAHSKTVIYDVARGEPRREKGQSALQPIVIEADQPGDCIGCNRCVNSCPTGMDIRRGLQLECINCMACLDACDEVMRNVKKPEGLISYTSQNAIAGKPVNHLRPRVVVLGLVLLGVVSGLGWVLLTRPPIKATIFKSHFEPYQVVETKQADQMISNEFYLMASNYTFEDGTVKIVVEGAPEDIKVVSARNPVTLNAGEEKQLEFFVLFRKHLIKNGNAEIKVHLLTRAEDGSWQRELTQEVPLVGPF